MRTKIILIVLFVISVLLNLYLFGQVNGKNIKIEELDKTVAVIKAENEKATKQYLNLFQENEKLKAEKTKYYPEYVHDEDYNQAYEDGRQEGYDEGQSEGYDTGREDGKEEGRDEYYDERDNDNGF